MPEIRFYWNGFKVYPANPDAKLVKTYYDLNDDGSVEILVEDAYKGIPQRVFPPLEGFSYFPTQYVYAPEKPGQLADWDGEIEGVIVYPDHPLYRHVKWAYYRSEIHKAKQYIRALQRKLEDPLVFAVGGIVERIKNTRRELEELEEKALYTGSNGRPEEHELEAVDMLAKVFIREFNEQLKAERRAREEKSRAQIENGTKFICFVSNIAPIKDGEPVVTICWSEHPAFYNWADNELKLSVPAADLIFKYFDTKGGSGQGYDKTKFVINYTDPETGEPSEYGGRYDIGDGDGGLIEHMRAFGQHKVDHPAVIAANYLDSFIPH